MSLECFITVGTTKFEDLMTILESESSCFCTSTPEFNELRKQCQKYKIQFKTLQLADSKEFTQLVMNSCLVISHAGAGSILEALRAKKKLIAVVNEKLQENHQVELANAMSKQGYLFSATCATLCEVLRNANFELLKYYPTPVDSFTKMLECEIYGNEVI